MRSLLSFFFCLVVVSPVSATSVPRFAAVIADIFLLEADDFDTRVGAQDRLLARLHGEDADRVARQLVVRYAHTKDPEGLYRLRRLLREHTQSEEASPSLTQIALRYFGPATLPAALSSDAVAPYVVWAKALRKGLLDEWKLAFESQRKEWDGRNKPSPKELAPLHAIAKAQKLELWGSGGALFFRDPVSRKAFGVALLPKEPPTIIVRPAEPLMVELRGTKTAALLALAGYPIRHFYAGGSTAMPSWQTDIVVRGDDTRVQFQSLFEGSALQNMLIYLGAFRATEQENPDPPAPSSLDFRWDSYVAYRLIDGNWVPAAIE